MPLLLACPPQQHLDRRPRRPHRRSLSSRQRGFEPTIRASTTTGNDRSDAELVVRDALTRLGCEFGVEDVELKVVKKGRKNGRHGWRVFDFRVGTVFIEVSMYDMPTLEAEAKLAAIDFVRDRYHLEVVHVTAQVLEAIAGNPDVLARLIRWAERAQGNAGASRYYSAIAEAATATTAWRTKRLKARNSQNRGRTTALTAGPLPVIMTVSNALA